MTVVYGGLDWSRKVIPIAIVENILLELTGYSENNSLLLLIRVDEPFQNYRRVPGAKLFVELAADSVH